jgi:hypothetical protein
MASIVGLEFHLTLKQSNDAVGKGWLPQSRRLDVSL